MSKQQELLERIQAEFQPHFATVENESHMHSSGRGDDSHFKLVIVSDAFEGMRKVQRHQKLYQLFADDLKNGIHALDAFQKVLNINVTGTFNMLRFAADVISRYELKAGEEDRGIIVNTASVAAYDGQIGPTAYAASKGAVVAMTLPLARELAQHAIRVVTIAPGIMETPMLKSLPQNVQDALGEMVPFPKRLAKPEEFAHLVGHICENGYLNGETIRLDGAIRMQPR